jgi:hypothetical protein
VLQLTTGSGIATSVPGWSGIGTLPRGYSWLNNQSREVAAAVARASGLGPEKVQVVGLVDPLRDVSRAAVGHHGLGPGANVGEDVRGHVQRVRRI